MGGGAAALEAVAVLLAAGADHAAKSGGAGLPRNYLAQRVNTRAVEEAQKRHVRAAAGRAAPTKSSLEWEYENGIDLGASRNAFTPEPRAWRRRAPRAAGRARRGERRRHRSAACGALRGRGAGAGGARRPAAAAAAPPDDDTEVVVAGLVGSGGGGLTALTFAAREGDIESRAALLDAGAERQPGDRAWLDAAAHRRQQPQLRGSRRCCIERGADANLANKGGWTPLYLATDNRNIEGGDYPVPKPDLDHLEIIEVAADARAPTRTLRVPRQHADARRSSRCSGSSRTARRRSSARRSRATPR